MNPLTIFKRKPNIDMKEKILKNKEAVLDVMGQNIKGARQCPLMLGQKCIGQFCELYMEWKNINPQTQKEISYWRCSFQQIPLLLIELCQEIRQLKKE